MTSGDDLLSLTTVIKRNVHTGQEQRYTVEREAPIALFEPTFAPRSATSPEGDGYLIVPVSRFVENCAEFLLFDTQGIEAGPIAQIELPVPIGWTPHGHYLDLSEAS